MKITREDLEGSKIKLLIEVDEPKIKSYRTGTIKRLANEVNVDGFRKGHVPESILIKKLGADYVNSQVLDDSLPKIIAEAVLKENIQPLDRPNVDIKNMSPFTIEVAITKYPEVKLGDYKSVKVEKEVANIEEKEIEETIERLKTNFTERHIVERESKKDDFVEIDFEGKDKDGVVIDGTVSKRHPLVIGLNTFIPGFEDELIGLKKDDEKTFDITFPKDYHAKHLADKPVTFTVKMLEVFEQKKPELDESFAEKVMQKKMSVEEFKTEIKNILQNEKESKQKTKMEVELLEKWADISEVEVPDFSVNLEIEDMIENVKEQSKKSGLEWEKYLEGIKKTEEDLKNNFRDEAYKKAKQRFVFLAIIKDSNIEFSDDEVRDELRFQKGEKESKKISKKSSEWINTKNALIAQKIIDDFLEDYKEEKKEALDKKENNNVK